MTFFRSSVSFARGPIERSSSNNFVGRPLVRNHRFDSSKVSNAEQSLHQSDVDVYLVVTEAAFGEFWSVTGVVFGLVLGDIAGAQNSTIFHKRCGRDGRLGEVLRAGGCEMRSDKHCFVNECMSTCMSCAFTVCIAVFA